MNRVLVTLVVLTGCSESTPSEAPPAPDVPDVAAAEEVAAAPDVEAPNAPPVWSDAPASLTVEEGRAASAVFAPSDPDGDPVTASVTSTAPDGLEASIADGTLVLHAAYGYASEQLVRIALDDGRGGAAQVDVPVTIAPLRWFASPVWTAPKDGPPAREHGAMWSDGPGGRLHLFGGSGYSPQLKPLSDLWAYDPAQETWTPLTAAGDVLSGGGSRRVAQGPERTEAWLFGGYDGKGAPNNELFHVTWSGDTVMFATLKQSKGPSPRSLHAFAYDATAKRFVVFGGVGTKPLGDLWTMTIDAGVATWTEVKTTGGPTARYGFFAGQDEATGRLIVFSGAQGTSTINPAKDTWALDIRADEPAWELLDDGADGPPGRRNGCTVFDPTGSGLFIFGGTSDGKTSQPGLWAFDARPGHARWALLEAADAPPIRSSGFGLYDATTDLRFCGFGNSNAVYTDFAPFGY